MKSWNISRNSRLVNDWFNHTAYLVWWNVAPQSDDRNSIKETPKAKIYHRDAAWNIKWQNFGFNYSLNNYSNQNSGFY